MLKVVEYLKKTSIVLFIFCSLLYAQQKDTLDTVELKSSKTYQGKVLKVTTTTIEFKEALTKLNYEFEKDDIKFVRLADGTTLTFNERAQLVGGDSKQAQSEPPKPETPTQAEQKDNSSMSRLIIITAGAVVGVLLLAALIF